jgi:hypothetical protein
MDDLLACDIVINGLKSACKEGGNMKIALVVMESRCGESEKNCDKICGYIEKAGREGVAFIVFPKPR